MLEKKEKMQQLTRQELEENGRSADSCIRRTEGREPHDHGKKSEENSASVTANTCHEPFCIARILEMPAANIQKKKKTKAFLPRLCFSRYLLFSM